MEGEKKAKGWKIRKNEMNVNIQQCFQLTLTLLITFKNIWFLTFLNYRTCVIITNN